jgi:hypothetical protein
MPFSEALRRVPGYSEEDIVRIMDAKAAEMDTGDAEEVPAVER